MEFQLLNELTESKAYRVDQYVKNMDLRDVTHQVFLDLLTTWILYNEIIPSQWLYAMQIKQQRSVISTNIVMVELTFI